MLGIIQKCYEVKNTSSAQYKNSYFVKAVCNWNALDNNLVYEPSLDKFQDSLKRLSDKPSPLPIRIMPIGILDRTTTDTDRRNIF